MFAQSIVMKEAGWGCKRHVAEVKVSFFSIFMAGRDKKCVKHISRTRQRSCVMFPVFSALKVLCVILSISPCRPNDIG